MKRTGAAVVVQALEDEGVPFTFGIPGTHNIELYDALAESESVHAVLVTDEQSASFMADGLWRASGHLGCVNVVPGAGLTHALSGIAEAFMDHVPLLVLGCGIRRDTGRAFQLHDVDQQALVGPLVKASYLVEKAEDLYSTVRTACRTARDGVPGPVFVEVPANLYLVAESGVGSEPAAGGAEVTAEGDGADRPSESGTESEATTPDLAGGVAAVAKTLWGARRPLLYVGAGAAGATAEVLRLAELLEAPVSTTFQGKGVFPETHPLFLWPGFGEAAPKFVRRVAQSCDMVLAVGCRFAEVGTGSYGLTMPGPLLHVDLDPEVFQKNYPAEVTVEADAREFLLALLAKLEDRGEIGGQRGEAEKAPDQELRRTIRVGHESVWKDLLRTVGGPRVTPALLLKSLQERLGADAIYTTDSGNGTFLAMECLRLDGPGKFLAPVDFSCMGYSVPAAIGAKLGEPDFPTVALAGDGAFLMTGLELLTAVQAEIGVIVMVLRDRELAQIAQFQDTALSRKVASSVADYDLKSLAAGMGVAFLDLPSDDEIPGVIDKAMAVSESGQPVLVDVAIDYTRKTFFTEGVVKTNLLRLPLKDQVRFVGRAIKRRLLG
ncbi:MAG: thiamine pyrophosphate-binding protein [Gemmatimonadetes bacterium]|nr:thiamine pyrophosphate-binding protein [Gemmatimonadota bacterium]